MAPTSESVCGPDTAAAATAFLVTEPTMSQRLLRARRKIAHVGSPSSVPEPRELPARVDGVLAVT